LYKTKHKYYLYIISNKKEGVLYVGVTNNLERRMFEHKSKLINGFSSKYNLTKLVYFEEFQFIEMAIKREKNIKKWKRDWKIKLIIDENPNWEDLSKDWF